MDWLKHLIEDYDVAYNFLSCDRNKSYLLPSIMVGSAVFVLHQREIRQAEKYDLFIVGCCLMTNHVHLLDMLLKFVFSR